MKMKRLAGVVAGTAVVFASCPVAPASAINDIKGFGVQETLKDFYSLSDFSSEIGYTVRNLKPSGDGVPVAGRLYEANVTTDAVVGTVVPQINDFLARTPGRADYRALSASTLSGAPLGPGGSASGKLYFDVVGDDPDSVIYNSNFEDQLGWVGLQPVEGAAVVPGTDSAGGSSSGSTSVGPGGSAGTGSTGGNQTGPSGSSGGQNGSYGPAGGTPPVGGNGLGGGNGNGGSGSANGNG